ncbi:MAG: glucose-6-phosphate isomerase [Candidatus Aureabacteria bacterium]|nr:glucose-6-phosphate isomerase [Candidatus Auribacterota bacterium]
MAKDILFDFNNSLAGIVGQDNGCEERDIESLRGNISKAVSKIETIRKEGNPGFVKLPFTRDIASEISEFAESIKDKYENFVVLGIGGSALGNIALNTALTDPYKRKKGLPKLFVMDNIDPEVFSSLLEGIDLRKTVFNVITKSGGTSETMSQFLIVRSMLEKMYGKKYREHIIATTDPEKGDLKAISEEEGYKTFCIPQNVGGRFSVLSPVGLLSAAVTGIDIHELLAGAEKMDMRCRERDYLRNPAYMYAILHYILDVKKNKKISVMMPYSTKLRDVADWYRQLWAESLGKTRIVEGNSVFVGQTPVKALGATDQHSQVQLYVEGPNDKYFIFVGLKKFAKDIKIPAGFEDRQSINYLSGHTMGELFHAEQKATTLALTKAKRPNATIWLPEISGNSIGQLLYMLELATAFAGYLLEIDPFNQPGVEEGKKLTYALMGRPGFEEKKAEIEKIDKPDSKYII